MAKDPHTPREGYKGRKGGDPYTPESATPRYTGTRPGKYPTEDNKAPRQGFKGRQTGDPKTPDIPAPNVVEPIAWRKTDRDEKSRTFPK